MIKKKLEKGQTLIEILLAFSVSILVLSAIMISVGSSLSNTQYTKNQNQANSYAQEAMAVVRKVRDASWIDFVNYSSNATYCLDQGVTIIRLGVAQPPLVCGINVGIFTREIFFSHNSAECSGGSKVIVRVSWADNKCPIGGESPLCHKVELITCFSNLDQKQAP